MDAVRTLDRRSAAPSWTHHCSHAGCHRATRESKPFCTLHVAAHPYVAQLLGRLARQQSDLDRAKRRGSRVVDPGGPTAQEILRHLEFSGPRSVRRLAQELGLDPIAVGAFVQALVRRGRLLIEKARGVRGGRVRLVA